MPADQPRVALVYAPFGRCEQPALGISLLKSALARQDACCDIHYLNIALANELGVQICDMIANRAPSALLAGEWLFAPSLLGENAAADNAYVRQVLWGDHGESFTPAIVRELLRIRERLPAFVDACAEEVDWSGYDWVGFSSSFHQHCASLALAQRIKSRFPAVRIIFGGTNCFGAMGAALCRLFPFVDYVCTGYGDVAFPALVRAVAAGEAAPEIPGITVRAGDAQTPSACEAARVDDLDALPYPDYSDYFNQLKAAQMPPDFETYIPMETSRGCWWGEKQLCTFCGFNTTDPTFRRKSPERVLDEMRYLGENHGSRIRLADTILARDYFRTVLPELARRPQYSLALEVRADLTREQVSLLAKAGVEMMQPGIESLSDPILRLMCKGTTCVENIQVLKWAKQYGIHVAWNLLWGFPGEEPAEYAAMQQLIPHLAHLGPPSACGHIRIDRFSAYWAAPASYGVANLQPSRPYKYVYHSIAENDLRDLAYCFDGEYPDDSANYAQGVRQVVAEWQSRTDAALDVFPSPGAIRIVDTRRRGEKKEWRFDGLAADLYLRCDAAQSMRKLMGAPSLRERAAGAEVAAMLDHFVAQGLMFHDGKRYLSLAILREESPSTPARGG